MTTTLVHFEANTVTVANEPRYRLYASCTVKGSLKDTHIFLHQIVDPSNPLLDVFARVLQVSDFDTDVGFKSNRYQAISAGHAYWRAASMLKLYEEVDVAVQAKQVLEDEINRLITEYVAYSEQYETSGEDIEFPTEVAATVEKYVALYDTTLTNYQNSLTAQMTAHVALTTASDNYEEIAEWLKKEDDLRIVLDSIIARMGPFLTSTNTFAYTNCGTVITAMETPPGTLDPTQQAALDAFKLQRADYLNIDYPIGVGCKDSLDAIDLGDYYPVTSGDLAAAEATLAAAQTASITADAAVQVNYTLLEASYEAVKTVCPSWIPDEPLPPRPPA
jgi:hypothetical protein